jgi:hypothetical protein
MNDGLTDYFRKNRAEAIKRYKSASLWVQRWDARRWALHYGALIRRMERAQ